MLSRAVRKPTIHHCAHKDVTEPCSAPAKCNLHPHYPVLKIYFNVIPRCISRSLKISVSLWFSYAFISQFMRHNFSTYLIPTFCCDEYRVWSPSSCNSLHSVISRPFSGSKSPVTRRGSSGFRYTVREELVVDGVALGQCILHRSSSILWAPCVSIISCHSTNDPCYV